MTVCPNQESMGYHYDGGFAEYCWSCRPRCWPSTDSTASPTASSFAEASVAEPLACVLNGQELARVGEGDDVVVVGSGPIGCLHVRLARARGAARVFLVDLNAERLRARRRPRRTGRDDRRRRDRRRSTRCSKLTDGRGADVVITAAASGAAQEQALQMTARQGRISFFGGLPKDNPIIAVDSQPRALPRTHDRRRQRFEPGPQRRGARLIAVRGGARSPTSSPTGCRWTTRSRPSTSSPAARPSR